MPKLRTIEQLETRRVFASDWQNAFLPCDVDQSAYVTPLDALTVINQLNRVGSGALPVRGADATEPFFDVDGDGSLSPLDVVLVVNALNVQREPMALVAGLSPASDPNGNGVVLDSSVTLGGQSLPGIAIEVTTVGSNHAAVQGSADNSGRFSFSIPVAPGIQTLRLRALDQIGRSLFIDLVVRKGDVIQDWNAAALDVIREWSTTSNDPYEGRIVPSQPPRVARNLAMIHTAMFDAVNSIDRMYEPYLVQLDAGPNAIPSIAAAAAAHQVASRLYAEADERAVWDASLAETLSMIPVGVDVAASLALGRQVGDAVLASRASDGSTASVAYTPGNQPGNWGRTAPGFLPPLLPQWPLVRPFAMESGGQFRPAAPPSLDSADYAEAVDQLMRLGGYNSSERTAEQTEIALFWADGGGTFTPPGHWNQIASDVSLARRTSLTENARMFALLNIALADAGIASWDAKYAYDLWRPIDAIREANTDGNSTTNPDPLWMPLINTPPFPTYTSGHSTFSGAAAAVLTALFGDNVAFTSQLDGQNASSQRPLDPSLIVTRSFASFEEAAGEAGLSRIYGGIHFAFDNSAGHAAGNSVGQLVANKLLKRI